MLGKLTDLYYRLVLDQSLPVLVAVGLFVVLAGYFAQGFKLDASSDSLILENDADLRYYRGESARYGSDDFLVVTYRPQADLMSDGNRRTIGSMGVVNQRYLIMLKGNYQELEVSSNEEHIKVGVPSRVSSVSCTRAS